MSQLDKFKKKWGASVERTKKENRKAAEGHMLKEMTDKKLATESLEEKMIRTGVENFETGEVVDYKQANADDNVWGFMNKSFYNKLIEDTKLQTQEKVEAEMMEQLKGLLNEVLDARESNKRAEELRLAELRIRELELQVELAKLKVSSTPVEFELTPMIPVTHGKLEEVIEEHTAAVETILDAVVIAEKPAKKKRVGRPKGSKNNKAIGGQAPVCGLDYTPLRNAQGRFAPAWKKLDEAGHIESAISAVVMYAKECGVDVSNGMQFKKYSTLTNGAYQQYTMRHKGEKGAWNAFIETHIQ